MTNSNSSDGLAQPQAKRIFCTIVVDPVSATQASETKF